MKRIYKMILIGTGVLAILIFVGLAWMARMQAARLIQHPSDAPTRFLSRTPEVLGLAYEEVQVNTADGLNLVGWYLPSRNGAAILVQHGFRGNRSSSTLDIGAMVHRHGYGVLFSTIRGHDRSDGDRFDFKNSDEYDLAAWFLFLEKQAAVDTERLGIYGQSLGGALAIRYAARNPAVKAIVTHSAPVSFNQTLETGIRYFTGLPPILFTPFIKYWLERDWGMESDKMDQAPSVHGIGPIPIFLLHGGADTVVGPDSGHLLLDAALEPKAL
jgi:dipeptidyl aminopeptidase/acylaminoacyl peptidase